MRPMYITVQGTSHARTGEHISLRVVIFNFWEEAMDVLITIPHSDDYQVVTLGEEQEAVPVDGGHQVRSN